MVSLVSTTCDFRISHGTVNPGRCTSPLRFPDIHVQSLRLIKFRFTYIRYPVRSSVYKCIKDIVWLQEFDMSVTSSEEVLALYEHTINSLKFL